MKPKCLFCDSDKEGSRVEDGKDFICGSCVAKFLTLSGDKLGELYKTACDAKKVRKATALSVFIPNKPTDHQRIEGY